MATAPIYAGGSRRSAAPAYTPAAFPGTAAVNYDEELIRQLVGNMNVPTSPANTGAPIAVAPGGSAPTLSEIFGSGTNVIDFGGGMGGEGAATGNTGANTGGISPGTIGAIGSGLSALGTLGQDATASQIGGMMGAIGALGSATSPSEAAATAAQIGLSMAGVPGVGVAANAISGNTAGMVNSAIASLSPALGAINALSGLATGQTIGSIATGIANAPTGTVAEHGIMGAAAIGNAGAMANAVNAAAQADVDAQTQSMLDAIAAETASNPGGTQGGVTGIGVNSAEGINAMDAESDAASTAAANAAIGIGESSGSTSGTTGPGSATGVGVGSDTGVNGMDAISDAAGSSTSDSSTSDGGGGGGGGAKIICTKLHELGMMPTAIYEADQAFGKQLVATAPATYAGYVRWARHIVALMDRTDWIGKLAIFCSYHVATPWSVAMAAEMGMEVKPSWFGRFLMKRGLQFCALVSKLPSKQPAGMLA